MAGEPMTRERFAEILREYDYTEHQIELLWSRRPLDIELEEGRLRQTAKHFQYKKDQLVQE